MAASACGGPPGHSACRCSLSYVFAVPAMLLGALVEELQSTNGRLSTVLDGISDGTAHRSGRLITVINKGAAGGPS